MSVRAYKLIKVVHAETPTFNCWHDEKIVALADKNSCYEDGGELTFQQSTLEEALKDKTLDEETITALKQMIKECGEDEMVTYYCY